jgi:alpha-1,3-glucan synthase
LALLTIPYLSRFLSIRLGDWPIYSLLLAFGQVISINSYQIVLLTGSTSQDPSKLYIVSGSYIASSFLWWILVRNFPSVYSLSAPWFFFGFAFLLLGTAPIASQWWVEETLQNVATAMYGAGASSGALAFALNFGDEGKHSHEKPAHIRTVWMRGS